jgi:hypothetical protein
MKRPVLCALALAALAAGTSMSASAQVYERRYEGPYVEHRYGPPVYAYDSGEYDHFRHECRAPRWDPNERYMPGQEVRRNGQLYVATEVSRHVYNVNSPPEWTPNYWRPVQCR